MNKENLVAAGLAVGIVGALGVFVWKLHKMQLNLVAIPKASLHKVGFEGITIRLDVALKNPTSGTFSIKFPFIKLIYKDAVIGSSNVINKDIEIPAYGQVVIERIMIDIPLENVFSVASSMLKAIQNKQPVKIKAEITTTAFIGINMMNMPFSETYDLSITP